MNRESHIFIAGGNTLVGSALRELLPERGFDNLVGVHDEPDLTDAADVEAFFDAVRPEFVFLVGGQSGGIGLNRERPAYLMLDNLRTIANVIDAAHRFDATKLLYLASSCVYPKHAPQPLRVESLGSGPMEPTSEAYSTAKFAGWKLCDAYRRQHGSRFITCFPANVFGPHDDFGAESGHVIPGLIRRTHEAKENGDAVLTIWGTGTPRREFIFSRDLADACVFAMQHHDGDTPLNLGRGTDFSISEVARTIVAVIGYHGHLEFDTTKPDGAPRKGLDSSALFEMGWRPRTEFRAAIAETYNWFLENVDARAAL
jgi:GDP-L-fucose synthase